MQYVKSSLVYRVCCCNDAFLPRNKGKRGSTMHNLGVVCSRKAEFSSKQARRGSLIRVHSNRKCTHARHVHQRHAKCCRVWICLCRLSKKRKGKHTGREKATLVHRESSSSVSPFRTYRAVWRSTNTQGIVALPPHLTPAPSSCPPPVHPTP